MRGELQVYVDNLLNLAFGEMRMLCPLRPMILGSLQACRLDRLRRLPSVSLVVLPLT
jgi:hypothetical protein